MRATRGKWAQVPAVLKRFFWVFLGLFIVVFVISLFGIRGFIPSSEVFDFLSGLLAGIFGILIGFSLDRVSEVDKDSQTKDDFLNLIREELTDTKNSIYPQKEGVYILYTDIWDSVISSGVIRLLTTEQVSKLSRVYKAIKGASYEAEWIGRNSEELDSLHYDKVRSRAAVTEKLAINIVHHNKRMEDISKMIDEVLREEWWTKTS
ncbi:MAG: hypothetical protein ABSA75_04710 [Candidatus Bathyarchaeia archaeon]|jgi:hypothetical protein